jgi:predicted nucleic acid-binding protein
VKRRYLFDVNALVGLLWAVHSLHGRANGWFSREAPEVLGCAFTELSFIRVSMADKTIAATFEDADAAIAGFIAELGDRYHFVDRLPSYGILRRSGVRSHKDASDFYPCELAARHAAHLATLDVGIRHPAAVLIA